MTTTEQKSQIVHTKQYLTIYTLYTLYIKKTNVNWVVMVKRMNCDVNFTRTWKDFVAGFGKPDGDMWIGLDKLHRITASKPYTLRVDIVGRKGKLYFAEYSHFYFGSAVTNYRLGVYGYKRQSTAGDSLTVQRRWKAVRNGRSFSTFDNDNCLPKTARVVGGMMDVTFLIQQVEAGKTVGQQAFK